MLGAVGVNAEQELVYSVLIDHPGARVSELTTPTGMHAERLSQIMNALEGHGLVSATADSPPRYLPAPPQVAIEALIAQHQDGIEQARLAATHLMDRYREQPSTLGTAAMVEIIHGRDALRQRFHQLQRNVQQELCILDRPPYVVSHSDDEDELRLLGRGVTVRCIYERSVLDDTERLPHIRLLQDRGEIARVLPDLPIKLALADRSVALLPLAIDQEAQTGSLIHPCGMLDAVISLFEALWNQAVPLRISGSGAQAVEPNNSELSERDQQLLTLMLAGLQDQAAASHLGVARRTVARQVTRLMELANADTRFQLGWRAAHNDWV